MSDVKREWFEVDYYKILGVPSTATAKEITAAYRKLAREYHPDTNPGDAAAEERFKELSGAYDVVGDEDRRKEYDQVRAVGPMGGMFGGGGGGGGARRPGQGAGGAEWDFEGMGDLGDLLGSVFGGGRFSGGGRPAAHRGADFEARLSISFDEAINGLSTTLSVGADRRQVKVNIPSGIESGQRVRLRGKGAPGAGGGPDGDLLVTIEVGSHPIFGRSGKHLTIDAPITFPEAALGADLKVPTFDGSSVTIRIPAGTQPGKKFRAKGKGVTTSKGTGDLIVTVEIVVPTNLSKAQRTALEDYAALQTESPRASWDQ